MCADVRAGGAGQRVSGGEKESISVVSYVRGDATRPEAAGPKVIVHICNDVGGWGRGFVLALSRRFREPEACYRAAFAGAEPPALGDVQLVSVADDITVANLIGQRGLSPSPETGEPPVRYAAIETGLGRVAAFASARSASVHMPRIGCGLAGGSWDRIEPILLRTLDAAGVATYVYDLP